MRKRIEFWLDDSRPQDVELFHLIENLKANRQFSTALQEGLRLWVDLAAHSTDKLNELFPVAVALIESRMLKRESDPQKPPSGSGGGGDSGQLNEINSKLELLISQQTTGGYLMQSAAPAPGNPKPLGGLKPIAAPVFDDDMPTVVIKKSETTNSSLNLVNAMQSLMR